MMYQRALAGPDGATLASQTHLLPEAPPVFDHCQFDALAASWKTEAFTRALFAMDMANPAHAPVMKLEGITERWEPPREEGYDVVRKALASGRFGGGPGKRG